MVDPLKNQEVNDIYPALIRAEDKNAKEDRIYGPAAGKIKMLATGLTPETRQVVGQHFKVIKTHCKVLTLLYKTGESTIEFLVHRMKVVPKVVRVAGQFLQRNPGIGRVVSFYKFFSIPVIYLESKAFKNNGYALIYGDKMTQIDAGIGLYGNICSLGESVSSFAKALGEFGFVNQSAITWAGPLAIISAVFSSFSIFIQAHGIHASKEFLDDFNKTIPDAREDKSVVNFDKSVNFIRTQSPSLLKKHFYVSGEKLKTKMTEFQTDSKQMSPAAGKGQMNDLVEVLQDRISASIKSRKLGVLIKSVSCIAIAILFTTSFTPLAYLLFLGCVLTSIYKTKTDAKASKVFEQALGFDTHTKKFKTE